MELAHTTDTYFSIWKPLIGPLSDWPLALCNLKSIENQDLKRIDVMHPAGNLESYRMLYNQKQRWGYFSRQDINELLILKSADSVNSGTGKIPKRLDFMILKHLKYLIVHLRIRIALRANPPARALKFELW